MAKKSKAKAKQEEIEMPSEDTSIAAKKYLSEADLKGIEIRSKEINISKLNIEVIGLKIKNTELNIALLQGQLEKLKAELHKKVNIEKNSTSSYTQNIEHIKSKYGIEGKFAFDPISGELFTE